MRAPALLLAFIAGIGAYAQELFIPLHDGWSFQRLGDTTWHTAEVPGVVHTDLLRHGLIPDPYVDFNADSVQWIEREDWVYRRTLMANDSILRNQHVDLVFKGLDTFADVYLNDSLIGRADNMFRTWEWPVKALLKSGANELKVVFRSAVREGERLRDAYGIQLPHDNDPSGVSPYVRKAAYHFGWDFAPRLVTCGIWQPVELRCWNTARISGLQTENFNDSLFAGGHTIIIRPAIMAQKGTELQVRYHIEGKPVKEGKVMYPHAGAFVYPLEYTVKSPQRWWPDGEGEQPLYTFRVDLWHEDRLLSTRSGWIGLSDVRLVQEKDSIGESFHFMVNDRPVFAKGCNLVPPDMFLPRAGDSTWVRLVRDMQDAHMNMVRVWAGGVYPPDAFFHACDTAGILVWQDLMFANMPPDDAAYRQNVAQEIKDQRERISVHPSLALWCGNNELDVAWKNWGWQATYHLTKRANKRIEHGYRALFQRQARDGLASPSDVPYVHTSPLSNWGNAEGLRNGDLHYWGVWHGDSTFASFERNVGRFVSEYGFQSYPDSSTLAKYLSPEQLHLGSAGLRYRQRSYKTDRPIHEAIRRELGIDPDTLTLDEFCEAGQQVQAIAYGLAARAHLAARPRCMGTLVWQLNDVWPGPSWSLIDHLGNRKPAFEAIRAAYAEP